MTKNSLSKETIGLDNRKLALLALLIAYAVGAAATLMLLVR